jgi:hypothetical protein
MGQQLSAALWNVSKLLPCTSNVVLYLRVALLQSLSGALLHFLRISGVHEVVLRTRVYHSRADLHHSLLQPTAANVLPKLERFRRRPSDATGVLVMRESLRI